jgi:hypothetical protein
MWRFFKTSTFYRQGFFYLLVTVLIITVTEYWWQHNIPPCATQPIVGVYFTVLYQALVSSRTRLLDHIQRRATVSRTPLNE